MEGIVAGTFLSFLIIFIRYNNIREGFRDVARHFCEFLIHQMNFVFLSISVLIIALITLLLVDLKIKSPHKNSMMSFKWFKGPKKEN